ncbi:MAG: hypothetical protein GW942_00690 [Candidatus Pacebacteria bacterium]|nr:hypothetical protein [Candidatus Paceibacterota bacterium]
MEKHSIQSIQQMMPKVFFDESKSESDRTLLKLIDLVTIINLESGSLTDYQQEIINQCALLLIEKLK